MTTTHKPSDAAFGQAYLRVMSRDGKWLCKADAYEFAAEVEKIARAIDAEQPQGEQAVFVEFGLIQQNIDRALSHLSEVRDLIDRGKGQHALSDLAEAKHYIEHCAAELPDRGALARMFFEPQGEQPAQGVPVDVAMIRRVIHELRTYNPIADHYNGKHIHPTWAKELEAALAASPAPSGFIDIKTWPGDLSYDQRCALSFAVAGLEQEGYQFTYASRLRKAFMESTPAPAAVPEGGEDALVPNIYRNEDTGSVCLDFDYFPDCQVSLLIKSDGVEVLWAVLNEAEKASGSFRLDDDAPADPALRRGFQRLASRIASRQYGDAPIGHYVNDYAGGVGRVWPSASYGVSEHGGAQIPEGMVLVPREIIANYRNSTSIPRHRRICDEALAAAPAQVARS